MTLNPVLVKIAQEKLGFSSLETRNSDALDFHEVAVWQVCEALEAAYEAGSASRLRYNIAERVATFAVGDTIKFHKADTTGCNEGSGEAVEVELVGKILAIDGHHATVEHPYGVCRTWLAIAEKA